VSERDGIERAAQECDAYARGPYAQKVHGENMARLIRALPPAEPDEPTAEMVEAAMWKWWHNERKPVDKEAAAFHAGYRAALRAARPAGGREGGA